MVDSVSFKEGYFCMKKSKPVIFYDSGEEYIADSCLPFKQAMADKTFEGSAWSRGQYPGISLKKSQLPGIRSVGYWNITQKQDWYLVPHYNEGIELTIVLAGSLAFESNGVSEVLTRGRVALSSPWQKHALGKPAISASKIAFFILDVNVRRPNSEWLWPDWVLLNQQEKKQLQNLIIRNSFPVFTANADFLYSFERVYELLEENPDKNSGKTSMYLNLILSSLIENLKGKPQTDATLNDTYLTVKLFLAGLKDHVEHNWNLEEMAAKCGISRSHLSVICNDLSNKSPMMFLNELRLKLAAQDLEHKLDHSITDICFDCGFGSSQYFSRRFSEHFGMSPRAYRKQFILSAQDKV